MEGAELVRDWRPGLAGWFADERAGETCVVLLSGLRGAFVEDRERFE